MSDPRESAWGDALPLLAKLSPVSAEGNPRIRFQGREYILIGEAADAAITTPELFEAGECSYAHLFSDGTVRRFGEVIGRVDEIEHLPAPEAPPMSEHAFTETDLAQLTLIGERIGEGIARKMGAISQRDRLLAAATILAREGLTPRDALALVDNLVSALEATDKTALDHLAAIFPFAESRAEDMAENADADPGHPVAAETKALANAAWAKVEDARKVLRAAGRIP